MPALPTTTVAARTPTRMLTVMSVTRTEVGVFAIHRRSLLDVRRSISEVVVEVLIGLLLCLLGVPDSSGLAIYLWETVMVVP